MLNNKIFKVFILGILTVSFTGCASLQKKFARKKKNKDSVTPIVTRFDYSKELRVDELYKKHFLFWKSWQGELIDRIDSAYKKRNSLYDNTIMQLLEVERYLTGEKKKEIEGFVIKIKSIEEGIRKKRLSRSEKYRIRKILENTKRQIDKKFSYNQVKECLKSPR